MNVNLIKVAWDWKTKKKWKCKRKVVGSTIVKMRKVMQTELIPESWDTHTDGGNWYAKDNDKSTDTNWTVTRKLMYVSNLFLLCISRTSVAVQRWNTTRTGIVCRPFTRKCCPTICIQKYTVAVIRICQDLQNKQKIKETDDRKTMNEEQIKKNVSKQISIVTSFLRFLWGNSESIWENSLFITNLKYLLGTTWIYTCDGLHIPLWGGKGLKRTEDCQNYKIFKTNIVVDNCSNRTANRRQHSFCVCDGWTDVQALVILSWFGGNGTNLSLSLLKVQVIRKNEKNHLNGPSPLVSKLP